MHVHLVFVTKYRRGVFTKKILDDLQDTAELVEFNGEEAAPLALFISALNGEVFRAAR